MGPTISVIIPTIGRPQLLRALASVAAQPGADDLDVIVAADTHHRVVDLAGLGVLHPSLDRLRTIAVDAGYSAWGHPQRNVAMQEARGAWLAFLDDDDGWTPGAVATIRRAIAANDRRVHIFRMSYRDGSTLWADRAIRPGNVGTPMVVVKNDPGLPGRWGDRYEGDYDFIRETVDNLDGGDADVDWVPETICRVRPWGSP